MCYQKLTNYIKLQKNTSTFTPFIPISNRLDTRYRKRNSK